MGGQGSDTGALTREDSVRAFMDQGYPADVALQKAVEQEQYDEAVRPYTLPDGRVVNLRGPGTPVAMAGTQRPDDIVVDGMLYRKTEYEPAVELPAAEVQGGVEGLPMVPATGMQAVANVLSRAPGVQELAENPLISTIAGGVRGAERVREGARGLLGQGVRMLPFGEQIGQRLIDQAARNNEILNALNMPFREANTGFNQMGQFIGETAATAPIGGVGGQGIRVVGQGVTRFAPRVGRIIERVGQAMPSSGIVPRATPVGAAAPSRAAQAGYLAENMLAGALTGGTQAALVGQDAGTGAIVGGALPFAARPLAAAGSALINQGQKIFDPTGYGTRNAADLARRAIGPEIYDAALVALRNALPGETAQQAMVRQGVEPSVFMGLGAEVRGAAPDAYLAIEAAQQAAMQAPIDRLAGGANLTAAQLTQRAEKQALRGATVPMQRAELAAADASGALDVAPVSAALMAQADAPGVGTTNSRVLAEIAVGLDALAARRGGVASADDLYAFRKDDLDDIISRSLSGQRGGDITSQAARRSELVRSAQQMLDDAIEAAGGTGWRQYLADYASGSETIRRQAMMGVAARQLRQNPNAFANTVEGDAPDVVSGVFGGNRIDLANLMNPTGVGPSGMDALTSAAQQIRRNQRVDVLAGEGRGAAQELIRQGRNRGPISGAINLAGRILRPGSAELMAAGSALLDAKVSQQTRQALTRAYASGASMAELIAITPVNERNIIAQIFADPRFYGAAARGAVPPIASAVNTMFGGEQPNAMSPPPQ